MIAFALALAIPPARAQAPGSPAWNQSQNQSASNRVAMDALQRRHGGGSGGCNALPAGWAAVAVSVDFPPAYRGYPAWVNSAELLPVGSDLRGFVATGRAAEVYVRPALHAGMNVTSHMCAPAGRAYWLVVDSGRQRIVIGQITLADAGEYQYTAVAPPLGH